MAIPSETIALPLVKGLDLQTDARLVQSPSLLEAENTQFSGGGAKKRRGHQELIARTMDDVPPNKDEWTFGAGVGSSIRGYAHGADLGWTYTNPEIGKLFGLATRDNETLLWDGFRLFSYTPSQDGEQAPGLPEVDGPAVFPSLRAAPLAKYAEAQTQPEFADNGKAKVMVWKSGTAAKYALYDSVSGAQLAFGTLAVTEMEYARAFTLGDYLHIAVKDADDDLIKLFSIHILDPHSVTYRSYGDARHFDLWKIDETSAVLVRTSDRIYVHWIAPSGAGDATHTQLDFTPANTTAWALVSVSAISTGLYITWYDGAGHIGLGYVTEAEGLKAETFWDAPGVQRLTISCTKVLSYSGPSMDVLWDDGNNIYTRRWYWFAGSVLSGNGEERVRYHLTLASRAFRVGDRTFFWAGFSSSLQSTWFLLDEFLLPVGKMDFGVADTGLVTGALRGVNFKSGEGYDSLTPRPHLALSAKTRVVPPGATMATSGIFTEPFPKEVRLDFLPRLRFAQAGRTTYIAGAQLWAYDGQELVEAGFHLGPEPTFVMSTGGSLDTAGQYTYRIDLCHRNGQGEEVRSLSILSSVQDLNSTNSKITITIPTVLTRREDSYFLIYRNAMSSGVPLVNWWLLNSRDPSSPDYLANDLSVASVSYVDNGSVDDTEIQVRELHPASDTYLQPISAPACEVIAAGRDRLWVSGGELPPGKVAPSRLFEVGDTPTFNAYLEFQVDRSNERVTALGFVGEVAAIFRTNSTYLLDSDGPDNNASGFWNPPRLALADVGALSQDAVIRTSPGLIFQSPAGFRLLGPGGALSTIGLEIDKVVKDFTVVGTLLVEKDQEIRFYGADETYVFNYTYGTWAHWTCGGVGVAKSTNNLALLARSDGKLWIETPEVYKDGATPYTHRIRTSWLHGGNVGDFQRVRRVGGLGRFGSLNTPTHTLRLEIFYDEREFWEERIEWEMPDSTVNSDTWGAGSWGDGVWGDTSATVNNLEDLTWEWVRRPSRQKCSVFSISLEDVNTDGPGFVLSAFTLELARKQGLNRTPERTGTGSYR